jgi:predicted ATPase
VTRKAVRERDAILRELRFERDRVEDWERFPFTLPILRDLQSWVLDPRLTFLVGENGSGKSTLLEALATKAGLNPEGGSKNFKRRELTEESALAAACTLVRGSRRERSAFFLRAETMFNVISEAADYEEYGWENLHERSHGEAFLWVALNRFWPGGLYLLDEPESALSPQRQLAFLARLHQLLEQGAQCVIATHSPILLAYPGATIYELGDAGIERVSYEETGTVALTRTILQDPSGMMRHIIEDLDAEPAHEDGEDDDDSALGP